MTDQPHAGTALVLEDDRSERVAVTRDANLKYDRTGKILLVPQPSDDPNDPLVRLSEATHLNLKH